MSFLPPPAEAGTNAAAAAEPRVVLCMKWGTKDSLGHPTRASLEYSA